jgi:hypothetical protein
MGKTRNSEISYGPDRWLPAYKLHTGIFHFLSPGVSLGENSGGRTSGFATRLSLSGRFDFCLLISYVPTWSAS